MGRSAHEQPQWRAVVTVVDRLRIASRPRELQGVHAGDRTAGTHEAGRLLGVGIPSDEAGHLVEQRPLHEHEHRRDLEGRVRGVEGRPQPVADDGERVGTRVVLIDEARMVRVDRTGEDPLGRIDEIAGGSGGFIGGETGADRRGEVGEQLRGRTPVDHPIVAARRVGDVVDGELGDRSDRVGRGRAAERQQVETVASKQFVDEGKGESDHVRDAAVDAVGEDPRRALQAVRAGLVVGLAARCVPRDSIVGQSADFDRAVFDRRVDHGPVRAGHRDGDTGHHVVSAVGEGAEHRRRVVDIGRLPEDHAVAHDGGVGGENDTAWSGRGRRLLPGETFDVGVG